MTFWADKEIFHQKLTRGGRTAAADRCARRTCCAYLIHIRTQKIDAIFFFGKNLCVPERFAAITNVNSRSLLLRFGACCRKLGGRQQCGTLFVSRAHAAHKSPNKIKSVFTS
jgi:hypothetical protein